MLELGLAVGRSVEDRNFHVGIAKMMEMTNLLEEGTREGDKVRREFELLIIGLFPYAPHVASEVWSRIGNESREMRIDP